jgi:hypothetical protein
MDMFLVPSRFKDHSRFLTHHLVAAQTIVSAKDIRFIPMV